MRLVALVILLAALCARTAAAADEAAPACDPRPHVVAFVQALNQGDLDALDAAFATGGPWRWYSVSDVAGRRLQAASMDRNTLKAYFAARIAQHETLELLRFRHSGDGNFSFTLRRRADDLREGRPVVRQGKGWLSCQDGRIGVWSLGGAPPPASFGPCPRNAVPLPAELAPARQAVIAFIERSFAEMLPSLDLRDARVAPARPAPGVREGYTARVRCSRAVQSRTAVVPVTFPRVGTNEPLRSATFYVSRLPGRWLVWRLIP
jgi:hypothetical protein